MRRLHKPLVLACAVGSLLLAGPGMASTVVGYNFNGGEGGNPANGGPHPTTLAANITATDFGLLNPGNTNFPNGVPGKAIQSEGNSTGGWTGTGLADAKQAWTFTINVLDGYTVDLTKFSFDSSIKGQGNQNQNGPNNWELQAFIGSNTTAAYDSGVQQTTAGVEYAAPDKGWFAQGPFTLSGLTGIKGAQSITFKLWGWGANAGQPWAIDNFNVLGDVTVTPSDVVPIPAAVWLFGSALLGMVGISRRGAVTAKA